MNLPPFLLKPTDRTDGRHSPEKIENKNNRKNIKVATREFQQTSWKKKKMLKQKTFLKKTRRGKVVKIVREHYTRTDIPCGSKACEQPNCPNDTICHLLDSEPGAANGNTLFSGSHYVLLDTNVILAQIDLIEAEGLQ